jgi:hypothetical protein
VDPGANPEELVLSRERLRLFLERCGALAGRRDYRRNARILALAVAGMNSGEIARAVGGALTARSIDGLLLRVRRYAAAHVLDAGLDAGLPAPPAAPRRAHRTGPRAAGPRAAKPRG